jgi:replicative DNA helicase
MASYDALMTAAFSNFDLSLSAPRRDDEVAQLRVPPQPIEADQSVLGGRLPKNSARNLAGDLLTYGNFFPAMSTD